MSHVWMGRESCHIYERVTSTHIADNTTLNLSGTTMMQNVTSPWQEVCDFHSAMRAEARVSVCTHMFLYIRVHVYVYLYIHVCYFKCNFKIILSFWFQNPRGRKLSIRWCLLCLVEMNRHYAAHFLELGTWSRLQLLQSHYTRELQFPKQSDRTFDRKGSGLLPSSRCFFPIWLSAFV